MLPGFLLFLHRLSFLGNFLELLSMLPGFLLFLHRLSFLGINEFEVCKYFAECSVHWVERIQLQLLLDILHLNITNFSSRPLLLLSLSSLCFLSLTSPYLRPVFLLFLLLVLLSPFVLLIIFIICL